MLMNVMSIVTDMPGTVMILMMKVIMASVKSADIMVENSYPVNLRNEPCMIKNPPLGVDFFIISRMFLSADL